MLLGSAPGLIVMSCWASGAASAGGPLATGEPLAFEVGVLVLSSLLLQAAKTAKATMANVASKRYRHCLTIFIETGLLSSLARLCCLWGKLSPIDVSKQYV